MTRLRAYDSEGRRLFVTIGDDNHLTLDGYDKPIVLRIERWIGRDKHKSDVYEGDTVRLPKKIFHNVFTGAKFKAHRQRWTVPPLHDTHDLTWGMFLNILSESVLQNDD